MIKQLLLITLITFQLNAHAQDYCLYDGQTGINFGNDASDTPTELLLLENGKSLVLGYSYYISSNHFMATACKLNEDGTLDQTFGTNGRVSYTWDSRNTVLAGAVQSDNKILIGGIQAPGNGVSSFRPYVARLNEDGSIDESFGTDGSALLEFSNSQGTVVGIFPLDNGKIKVAILVGNPAGYAVIQLDQNGEYDPEFAENGIVFYQDSRIIWQTDYGDALMNEDGSIVMISKAFEQNTTKPFISKITADGLKDENFGEEGVVIIETPIQYNYAGIYGAKDELDNILIGSTHFTTEVRYQINKIDGASGELDFNFGTDGTVLSSIENGFNALYDLIYDNGNETIYTVGQGSSGGLVKSAIWKLNSSGEEQLHCDGSTMEFLPMLSTQGLRLLKITDQGEMKFIGKSAEPDLTTPDIAIQNANFFIPTISNLSIRNTDLVELDVFPNPFNEILNIKYSPDIQLQSILVRNQLGQIVLNLEYNLQSIDVSTLENGVYIIEVSTSKGTAIKKLIKQ